MGWFSLITAVPSLISGMFGTLNGITKALSDAKIAAINAQTQEEKIHADEQVLTLQSRRDVLVAEAGSGSRINMIIRALFGIEILIVVGKLYVWDKVLGSLVGCSQAMKGTCLAFTTDLIDDNGWKIISVVIGFYFVSELTLGVTRVIKSR
jgi:hypothetical protein